MLEFWLNEAFSWAERRSVPVYAERNEYGDWVLILEFKDSAGLFTGQCKFTERDSVRDPGKSKDRRETDAEYGDRVCRSLDRACANARSRRTQEITKTGEFKNVA